MLFLGEDFYGGVCFVVEVEIFCFALWEDYIVVLVVLDFCYWGQALRYWDSMRTILYGLHRKIQRSFLQFLINQNPLILLRIIIRIRRKRILRHKNPPTFSIIIRYFKHNTTFPIFPLKLIKSNTTLW